MLSGVLILLVQLAGGLPGRRHPLGQAAGLTVHPASIRLGMSERRPAEPSRAVPVMDGQKLVILPPPRPHMAAFWSAGSQYEAAVPGWCWPAPGRGPRQRQRRYLTREEDHAFWAWAVIEVLRHTRIRVEELTELSHHIRPGHRASPPAEATRIISMHRCVVDEQRRETGETDSGTSGTGPVQTGNAVSQATPRRWHHAGPDTSPGTAPSPALPGSQPASATQSPASTKTTPPGCSPPSATQPENDPRTAYINSCASP